MLIRHVGRSLWRLIALRGEQALIVVVLMTAVIGLTRFAIQVSRNHSESEPRSGPEVSPFTYVEVRHLWLPKPMIWLAKRHARSPLIRNHEELQQFLEFLNLEDLRYAITVRARQAGGEFMQATYIRYPYDGFNDFLELMDVLATAAGRPPPYTDTLKNDFSTTAVQVMPEEIRRNATNQFISEQHRSLPAYGDNTRPVTFPTPEASALAGRTE